MKTLHPIVPAALIVLLTVLLAGGWLSRPVASGQSPAETESNTAVPARVPWTTSRVVGSPEPPPPYRSEHVLQQLTFRNPVVLTSEPTLDRMFVAELNGMIYSFPEDSQAETPDVFFDLKTAVPEMRQLYGMTFHPQFVDNRHVYICYVLEADLPEGTRVSRFRVLETDPPMIDPSSEQVVITWVSGGHNGGCLKFGPDGFLYISTGDAVGPNPPDTLKTGQDLTDLLSSILRIDVDKTSGDRPYRIPDDNPFIDLPGVRPENWAYGFRNPWKMSFDERTGDLWVGDVGWELWELVYRVERGGNYGWSIMEGRQPIDPGGERGPTPILPPIVEHAHSEAASITGGYVYYGSRLPKLQGAYVYGDYETGKVWGLRADATRVLWHEELTDTPLRIICFGEGTSGELYFMDYTGGTIHQLVEDAADAQHLDFPRTLSATGLFENVAEHQVAAGVVPFSINAEMWSDYGVAQRYLALPGTSSIQTEKKEWIFPAGTVAMKTISVPFGPSSSDLRRVETQLLHFDGEIWQTYTYAWNEEQTDAMLVGIDGMDRALKITDADAPGGPRQQNWHYASRAECQRCHNRWAGSALSLNTLQLDQSEARDVEAESQLQAWHRAGLISELPQNPKQDHLRSPQDVSATLEQRARSYLHVNCAHCHRGHAGGAVLSQMVYDIDLSKALLIDYPPSQGTFGIDRASMIAPGDPGRSVLLYRMAKVGRGRMPYLGSEMVDSAGVDLIYDWIAAMPPSESTGTGPEDNLDEDWLVALERLEDRGSDPRAVIGAVDQLVAVPRAALPLMRLVAHADFPEDRRQLIIERIHETAQPHVQELFHRFLPPEKQTSAAPRLNVADVLQLQGDPTRGQTLFASSQQVSCRSCHRVAGVGQAVGPDLDVVGKKYDTEQLLTNILNPSQTIDPQFRTYVVETTEGRVYTGVLRERTADAIALVDAQGKERRLPADDVEFISPQPTSLMPDLLLRDMTAQDVADLLAYLQAESKKTEGN